MVAIVMKHQPNFLARLIMAPWRGYTYIFYRLYVWNLKTWGKDDISEFKAAGAIAVLSWINLATIVAWISIHSIMSASSWSIIVSFGIWFGLWCFILLFRGRYKKIIERFKDEPQSKKAPRALLCWVYVIFSFVALTVTAIYA